MKWETRDWGRVEPTCQVPLLPQGLGVARVFVHEIGAVALAAHSEAVWANLSPLPLLGPAGVTGGLLPMSLWCIVLHSCRCFTLEAVGIACADPRFLPGPSGALRSVFLLAEAGLHPAACFVFPSPTFGSPCGGIGSMRVCRDPSRLASRGRSPIHTVVWVPADLVSEIKGAWMCVFHSVKEPLGEALSPTEIPLPSDPTWKGAELLI